MTASKDSASLHRTSLGASLPRSASRPHSHSMSLGSINASNRINRRKSSFSANGINLAAFAAAADAQPVGRPLSHGEGLGIMNAGSPHADALRKSPSALIDGPPLSSLKISSKARARRASEGSRLSRERRKSNAGELKCETCGKGYKHGSCLQKHLWEHTPEWALTSKLLISKHAQVQLLEAASVLVTMNQDAKPEGDRSDTSSQSPAVSGASSALDDDNSSRTSTPSQDDDYQASKMAAYRNPRRQDSYSSVFSRSYNSTAASSMPSDSVLRHWGSRPSTAGGLQSYTHLQSNDDAADIAAAAEGLVSCSIGTPQYRPVQDADVPPVPPLPAKFATRPLSHSGVHQHYTHIDESEDEDMFGGMEQ